MNPIRLDALTEGTTYRTDVRSTGIPDWEWEDSAFALAKGNASELETAAFWYRWRHAPRCRHILYGALMVKALDIVRRNHWTDRLDGQKYIDPMVSLALDVEAKPGLERLPGPWWQVRLPWMAKSVWERRGVKRYTAIRSPLDIWCGEAIRKARPFITDDDPDY